MQYIITFLLVTGTTFQIVQSAVDDQIQNTGTWLSSTFTQPIMWLKDFAIGTTNDLIHFPLNIKDRVMNVLTVTTSVPNIAMVNGNVPTTETVDDNVEEVKMYTSSKTVVSQDLVTDNGQLIQPPQVPNTIIIPSQDSETLIMTETDNAQVITAPDSKTIMSQTLEI